MPRFILALLFTAVAGFGLSACDSDDVLTPDPQEPTDNPSFLGCSPTLIESLPFSERVAVSGDSSFAQTASCRNVVLARFDSLLTPPELDITEAVLDITPADTMIVGPDTTITPADTTIVTPADTMIVTPADTSFFKSEIQATGTYYRLNLDAPRRITVTVEGDSSFFPFLAISPARADSVLAFATYYRDAEDTDADGELSAEERQTLSLSADLGAYGPLDALGYVISVGDASTAPEPPSDATPSAGAGYTIRVE